MTFNFAILIFCLYLRSQIETATPAVIFLASLKQLIRKVRACLGILFPDFRMRTMPEVLCVTWEQLQHSLTSDSLTVPSLELLFLPTAERSFQSAKALPSSGCQLQFFETKVATVEVRSWERAHTQDRQGYLTITKKPFRNICRFCDKRSVCRAICLLSD